MSRASRARVVCGLKDPPSEAKKTFLADCAKYCASDLRPPESMAGPGMSELIQSTIDVADAYGRLDATKLIPHPKTITRDIDKQATTAREDLINEARPALSEGRCSATTDGWTDRNTKEHFAAMTLHFMVEWSLESRVAFSVTVGSSSTSDQLKDFLRDKMEEMGIPIRLQDDIVFVTDGGADIVKALEEYVRLYCMAHALNVVVRNTLSVKYSTLIERAVNSSPEAIGILEKCSSWVQDVRNKLPKKASGVRKFLKLTNPQSQFHIGMLESVRCYRAQVRPSKNIIEN